MMLDQVFKKKTYDIHELSHQEFDNCTFINCSFEKTILTSTDFMECEFIDCNFSNARLKDTGLKDVVFTDCKLLGLIFSECNPFLLALEFKNCMLSFASFYQLKLSKTKFNDCNMEQVEFSEADLSKASFNGCDLKKAVFGRTNLSNADFRTAINYSIDPDDNTLKKAKFSKEGLAGLLLKHQLLVE